MSAMRKPRKPLTKIVEFEEKDLSIGAIKVHPEMLQTRAETDKGYSRAYAKGMAAGSKFPPVIVYLIDDEYWLADGFTRVDAAMSLGLPTIRAVIRHGTMEDALMAGIEANFDQYHSRSVNVADRNHAAELMIRNESFRVWPDDRIARTCGLRGITVKRMRMRLSEAEGIPIPDRILIFLHGQPTGRTRTYRVKQGVDRTPTKTSGGSVDRNGKRSAKFVVLLDGEEVYLGTSEEAANSRLEQINESRAVTKKQLTTRMAFVSWSAGQGVGMEFVKREECPTWGLCLAGVAVEPIEDPELNVFLEKCTRLMFCREARSGITRLVVVGYVMGVNAQTTAAANYARRKFGIEVMTPEEFVAEFGPEDGEGATVASPEPSPQLTGAAS